MRKIILLAGIIIFLTGCWPMSKGRIMRIYDCYDGKDTGIRSLIDINGYYTIPYFGSWGRAMTSQGDTIENKILFYENGVFKILSDPYYRSRHNGRENIPTYIKEVIDMPEGNMANIFYNDGFLGRYGISQDTITIQIVGHSGAYNNRAVFEYRLKIIDRHSLKYIDSYIRQSAKKKYYGDYSERFMNQNKDFIIYFTPLEQVPSIDNHWMLHDKRFICNDKIF